MKSMKIKNQLLCIMLIFGIGFLLLAFSSAYLINLVKVNGPIYQKVVTQKDLIADILPPPEYIIEIHLIAYQLLEMETSTSIPTLIASEKSLETDYETRHQYWLDNLPDGKTKQILVEDSYQAAKDYFDIFHNEYVLAIQSGDKEQASSILNNKLIPLYQEHRNSIQEVVSLANETSLSLEASTDKTINIGMILLFSLIIVILLIVILYCVTTMKAITAPLTTLTNHLSVVAQKDLSLSLPISLLSSKNEMGMIARAANDMQSSIKEIILSIQEETGRISNSIQSSNNGISILKVELEDASQTTFLLAEHIADAASSSEAIAATSISLEKAVEEVSTQATEGAVTAREVNNRAVLLKEQAQTSQKSIIETRQIISQSMEEAITKSKEVERIQSLAQVILEISEQTNLLSLNASIEAARAGEYGRGFAVVASEIGSLAAHSRNTVQEIQDTVSLVYESVHLLVQASEETLHFLDSQIIAGYQDLLKTGENYEQDAGAINDLVTTLSATAQELFASVRVVSNSIDTIAASSSQSAEASLDISTTVTSIDDKARQLREEIQLMNDSSQKLNQLVLAFTL